MYPGLTLNGIDNVLEKLRSGDHRSPQQATPDVDTSPASSQSTLDLPTAESHGGPSRSALPWPERLPDQVTLIRHFLATNTGASAEELSAHFGRKSAKRVEQIDGIVETLRGLGKA